MLNKNLKILIIMGHGGRDSGAVHGKLVERDMNVITGTALADLLLFNGFNVTLEPNNGDVNYEQKIANGYDLVISVHFNSGGGDGFECFCNPNNKETVAICKAIEKRVQAIGQNSRGIKSGIGYKMVSGINPNAIILEGGFIDNPNDSKLFDEVHEQKKLGQAYGYGILDYFGVKPKEESTKKKGYRVVTGFYSEKENALKEQERLKAKGIDSFLAYTEV